MPHAPGPSEIKLVFAYAAFRGGAGAAARRAFDRAVDAGWGLSVEDPGGRTVLGSCGHHRQPALGSRLLRAGADPDLLGADLSPPLCLAASSGATDCAFLLLSRGASPDAASALGSRALALAASRDNHALIKVLAKAGAELDARDASGASPLMLAARANHQKSLRALINLRAPLDSVDLYGRSALIHSARTLAVGPLLDLLAHGANPLLRGLDDVDALEALGDHAGHRFFPGLASALRQAAVDAQKRDLLRAIPEAPKATRRPGL